MANILTEIIIILSIPIVFFFIYYIFWKIFQHKKENEQINAIQDNKDIEKLQKFRINFKNSFWAAFIMKLFLSYTAKQESFPEFVQSLISLKAGKIILIALAVIELLLALSIIIIFSHSSYKLSNKKKDLLFGAFGVWILGPILPIAGFFVLNSRYKKKIEGLKSSSKDNTIMSH